MKQVELKRRRMHRRPLGMAGIMVSLAILLGGSTFLDPVDAPRYQLLGVTLIDGQRNATLSAVTGTNATFSGPVAVANLTTTTAAIAGNASFPANTGDVFVSGTSTISLPKASTVPNGRHLRVWNVGSGVVTVAAVAGDTLLVFGSGTALLLPKHSLEAISRAPTSWIVQVN